MAGGHARPEPARPGDERGAAGDRRARAGARDLVQVRERARCRDRELARGPRAGGRPGGLHRPARRRLGAAAAHAGGASAASRSSWPTTRPRRPASATGSAWTRRRARSRCCGRCEADGYGVDGVAGGRRRADAGARGGPTNELAGGRSARSRVRLPLARYRGLVRDAAGKPCGSRRGALGCPEARPARPRRRLRPRPAAARQRRGRHPAGARLPHRSEPRPTTARPRAAARLPRLLSSGCATSSARTRSCIWASTATSNGCPARRWRSRRTACPRRCWARCRTSTRSSSTIPARAPRPSGGRAAVIVDHLTPPLTRAESYGELARARAAARRILRRGRAATRAGLRASAAARSSSAARRSARGDLRHRARRRLPDERWPARRPSVRAEGAADPRRAARLRPAPEGEPLTDLLVALARAAARRRRGRRRVAAPGARGAIWAWRLGPARRRARREPWAGPRPGAARGPRRRALAHGRRHGRAPGAAGAAAGRRRARRRAGLDGDRAPCWPRSTTRLRPALAAAAGRDRGPAARARRPLRAARPERGADARAARRAADRAQLLLGRQPGGADAGRLAAGLEVGGARGRALSAGARRLAAAGRAVGLGHRLHAHRRRRHRAGAGADRRRPVWDAAAPGDRGRGAAARRCSTGRAST